MKDISFIIESFPNSDNVDIDYVRRDRYIALLEAAVSLHYHLFELTDTLLNRPDKGEREIADMLDDAQPALDKWNRFLDGKEE